MTKDKQPDNPKITLSLVTNLIKEQFPAWARLPIKSIEPNGSDNRTFRLGEKMSVRLPSGQEYALQVEKEQKWLPILAPQLSFSIPEPISMGMPSKNYPWNWSIYHWIEGESANNLDLDENSLENIAVELALFLNQLHKIDSADAPIGGLHNYYRGAHPSVYGKETESYIDQLQGLIDADKALAVWKKAISTKWDKHPVWVHGDFASGNILINNGKIAAIIDFGCMGIGDPACDLVIAWTLLKNKSKILFKEQIGLDADTWSRARGWALWKACFELVALQDKTSPEAKRQQYILNEILKDHKV